MSGYETWDGLSSQWDDLENGPWGLSLIEDSLELRVYNSTNSSYLGSLPGAYNRAFVDSHNDPGQGQFSISLSDPNVGLVQPWRCVRWRLNGVDVFTSIIVNRPRVTLDADEDPAMRVSGPGLFGWLGSDKGGAIIHPRSLNSKNGERYFGWASNEYPTAGWSNPNSRGKKSAPIAALPRLKGHPVGWPNSHAEWLWSRPLTHSGDKVYDPNGVSYFRRLLPGNYTGPARIYVAGTNSYEIYFDGERVGGGGGFRNITEIDVEFTGAPTVVGAAVTKVRTPGFKYDPGAFIMTISRLNEDGDPSGTIYRTFTPPVNGSGSWDWRALDYPEDEPGITPGRLMITLINEAKARGLLGGLTYNFTNTTDSNGNAWTQTINRSFRVGTKLSYVIQQLSELGIDFWITPTGGLRMQAQRGIGRVGGFGNLASQTISGDGPQATRLLGRTGGGYINRTTAGTVPLEEFAEFGDFDTPKSVRNIMDRMLVRLSQEQNEIDITLSANSPRPYVNFNVGDFYDVGRVTQIACTQSDDNGAVEWAVSLIPN